MVNRMVKLPIYASRKGEYSDSDVDDDNLPQQKPSVVKTVSLATDENEMDRQDSLASESSDSEDGSEEKEELASANVIVNMPMHKNPVVNTVSRSTDENEMARQDLLASESSESENGSEEMDTNQVLENELVVEEPSIDLVGKPEKGTIEDVNSDPVKDENPEVKKSTNLKSSKLLRMSLGDPEAIPDSSKTTPKRKLIGKKSIKRKRSPIDSDSDFEEDSDQDANSKPKSKRRLLKKTTSSQNEKSEDSDIEIINESQNSATGSQGRKNIRTIINDLNLKVM